MGQARLTLLQWRYPSVIRRAVRVTVRSNCRPNAWKRNGTGAKRPGKIQKTAFFGTSNRPYLGTTGVSMLRLEH
jgi:hypothetical protein